MEGSKARLALRAELRGLTPEQVARSAAKRKVDAPPRRCLSTPSACRLRPFLPLFGRSGAGLGFSPAPFPHKARRRKAREVPEHEQDEPGDGP